MPNIFIGVIDIDDSPPVVDSFFPAPGATNIPENTSITFNVTDIGGGVDLDSLDVSINSIPAISDGVFLTGFSGTITPISYGYTISITPDIVLAYNTQFTVAYYVQDLAVFFSYTSGSWSFTTKLPPTLYIMRAFCLSLSKYVYWSSAIPDITGVGAPCSPVTDIVISDIIDGAKVIYVMRAYRTTSMSYVYWSSVNQPDPTAQYAPFPLVELTDIVVYSIMEDV